MTDTDTTENDAQIDAGAPESEGLAETTPETETDTHDETEADDDRPGRREARYRKRAQEAEAQRDALSATVERLQRRQVEQVITAAGLKPAAVFAVAELKDLLAEDGTPDPSKLDAAVRTARDQLGITRPIVQRQMGMRSGASGHPQPKRNGWTKAFSPRDE
ncbi:hypothetical protein BN971_03731 [Mycobacterium bohemicum DSM 44277]|uniref:Uncharacterized protein n=2 Tax=Mycobacterium bohemicum TaxID=56425 RepID=A0A1X1R370_MYCBE|nr:hypothetical protein [Mycobacterium bohemicum]MCV6968868.1 hypothetical protein [Mycobacterium bohemicum]ORU98770.1 hypothetical protein AWB93_13080 [Mycobacterium bohemicum]CPR12432.1 hypothetical protein BN971_03731 [Mycobacterium bohemicum DSM 44277]